MQLIIDHIIPEPLQDRITAQSSDIWNNKQSFAEGELIFLRAPSGKGKSTFMHILYGLRKDYTGSAYWNGQQISNQKTAAWADWRSNDLSIVFQDLRLFGTLTVEENICIKQSLTNSTTIDTAQQWLKELGMEGKWKQRAETLSYGERQRVAIVRSLLQPFKWLLLDEPFSHLDDENSRKAAQLILDRVQSLNAGMMVVDLEDNNWFPYTRKMIL